MTNVVRTVRPRYVVQTGEATEVTSYELSGASVTDVTNIDWEFDVAYDTLEDAEQYAAKIARTTEHVRVIDRGED